LVKVISAGPDKIPHTNDDVIAQTEVSADVLAAPAATPSAAPSPEVMLPVEPAPSPSS
jgi:hypothetical protein